MTAILPTASALVRQAAGRRTLYLVQRPLRTDPELTLDVPCGRTRAVPLGRWPLDALPTESELAADLAVAMRALERVA